MADFRSIRLADILYSKLNYLRGKKSFPAYIESMVKYFELTGVNPESVQMPLVQEYKNGTERMVKLVKAIEKDKLNPILILLEKVCSSITKNQNFAVGVTEDQVEQLVNINQKLTNELDQLKREKIEFLQQNRSLNMEIEKRSNVSSSNVNIDEILMLIDALDDMATQGAGKDIFIRKEAIFDLANRMKGCLT